MKILQGWHELKLWRQIWFSDSTWFEAFEGSAEDAHPIEFKIPYVEVFYFPEAKIKNYAMTQKFSIKSSLSKPQLSADVDTFTEENLNGNFNVCAVLHSKMFRSRTDCQNFLNINSDHPKLLRKQNHT